MLNSLLAIILLLLSIFLILLILVQRGRGGGLAGAFGGMGGQSAFGTKAGDLFTRVTIGVAFVWIILCIISVKVMGGSANKFSGGHAPSSDTTPLDNSGLNLPPKAGASGAAADAGKGKSGNTASPATSATPETGTGNGAAPPTTGEAAPPTPDATPSAPSATPPAGEPASSSK